MLDGRESSVEEEFKAIDLGDRRLDKRIVPLAQCMATEPLERVP